MHCIYYDYQYNIKDTKDETIREALNTLCLYFPHLKNFNDDFIPYIRQCMEETECKSFFFNLCERFIYHGYHDRKGKKIFAPDSITIGEL